MLSGRASGVLVPEGVLGVPALFVSAATSPSRPAPPPPWTWLNCNHGPPSTPALEIGLSPQGIAAECGTRASLLSPVFGRPGSSRGTEGRARKPEEQGVQLPPGQAMLKVGSWAELSGSCWGRGSSCGCPALEPLLWGRVSMPCQGPPGCG